MVVTTKGSGFGSGLGADAELIDKRIHEFIMSETTSRVLDTIPMMFDTIKDGIIELLDERLGVFRAKIIASQFWARNLTFRKFKAYGSPEFFRKKDHISNRWWFTDMESAQRMSFYPEGSKLMFASSLLRD